MTGAWEKSLEMKMGSFFSGSGGFELAGERVGISTLWESEIEPFPMRVTQMRFPDAQHLGDIRRINGAELEPVDIVTGGSPCQNMSIAGNRTGLDGEQSVLFREYVRIVKEMRRKYGKPRIIVWENVPGAFSSNKGEDFRCVLEEIIGIAQVGFSVPRPPDGRWKPAGGILGDSCSVAWRVLDSQYWGVPQRRKRIYLVADFGGQCAGKILFERKGLFRDIAQGREAREKTSGGIAQGIDFASGRGTAGAITLESHPQDSRIEIAKDGIVQTLTGKMGTGGGNVPLVMETPKAYAIGRDNITVWEEKAQTLTAGKRPGSVAHRIYPDKSGALTAKTSKRCGGPAGDECSSLVAIDYIVRRLTPLECCRLQGFPDNWTDGLSDEDPDKKTVWFWMDVWMEWWALVGRAKGIKRPKDEKAVRRWLKKPESDTELYKMYGNGIALPCAQYVFEGIAEVLAR